MASPDDRTDAASRFQQGSREAFRELVEQSQARVRAQVACSGVARAEVDDIAQEAYIFIYEHIHEFEAGTNFEAWCKQIVRNKTRAYWEAKRREKRNRVNLLQLQMQQALEPAGTPDADSLLQSLHDCLQALGTRAREILEARYDGRPLDELSRQMNCTVAAVKMRLLRIRGQLRKCVEDRS